jgi:hypothetical protein
MEEQYLFPPLRTEDEMQRLRDHALGHIIHPLKREIIQAESKAMLQKALNNYA